MAMKSDDPEKMARMQEWLAAVEEELGLDHTALAAAQEPLLHLISSVAHGPSRPGAPLTAFLVGLAAGRGGDPVELTARIEELVRTRQD